MKVLEERLMYLFIVFCKDLLCVSFPFWLKDFHLGVYNFCFPPSLTLFSILHRGLVDLRPGRSVPFLILTTSMSFWCVDFDFRQASRPSSNPIFFGRLIMKKWPMARSLALWKSVGLLACGIAIRTWSSSSWSRCITWIFAWRSGLLPPSTVWKRWGTPLLLFPGC